MVAFRRMVVAAAMVLAFGTVIAPAASAAEAAPTAVLAPSKTYHVTRQCQIVRISDNDGLGFQRADGVGNTEQNADLDADRNVPAPQGHYKRHCQAKRVW